MKRLWAFLLVFALFLPEAGRAEKAGGFPAFFKVTSPAFETSAIDGLLLVKVIALLEALAGNTVAVTVTSGIGIDGAGSLLVNGIPHTFTSGSSYTWNVPVGANGAIIIQPLEGADWSVDLARIEIEGVITATTGAPSKVLKQPVGSMTHDSIQISSEYKQVKR